MSPVEVPVGSGCGCSDVSKSGLCSSSQLRGGLASFVTAASPRGYRWERAQHIHPMLKNRTRVYDFGAYLLEPGEMMAQLIRPLTALS